MLTYSRLEKPLTEAFSVFIPFGFVLLVFILNLFITGKGVSKNLLFNFTCVFTFAVVIIICLRSMFDTNMILFYKYEIDFNPTFFSDNLSAIEAMLYLIGGANLLLILYNLVDRKKDEEKKVDVDEIEGKHVEKVSTSKSKVAITKKSRSKES